MLATTVALPGPCYFMNDSGRVIFDRNKRSTAWAPCQGSASGADRTYARHATLSQGRRAVTAGEMGQETLREVIEAHDTAEVDFRHFKKAFFERQHKTPLGRFLSSKRGIMHQCRRKNAHYQGRRFWYCFLKFFFYLLSFFPIHFHKLSLAHFFFL